MTKHTTTTKNSYYACVVLLLTIISTIAQTCNPGVPLEGHQAPQGQCDPNGAECCKAGDTYPTYECSPPVTSNTNAMLTLNSFASGGDGGGPSECDGQYHSDDTPVVELSTGWYEGGSRYNKEIIIHGNGQTTTAMVVDKCDSRNGCDEEHGYQVPCKNNIVDASKAVWSALGVSPDSDEYGQMQITWSDA